MLKGFKSIPEAEALALPFSLLNSKIFYSSVQERLPERFPCSLVTSYLGLN